MVLAKDGHINDLKNDLQEVKRRKKEADYDLQRVQRLLIDNQKDHIRDMTDARNTFARALNRKDAIGRQKMKESFDTFKRIVQEVNDKNDGTVEKMINLLDKRGEMVHELLKKMVSLTGFTDRQMGDGMKSADYQSVGQSLMDMVNERQNEIGNKYVDYNNSGDVQIPVFNESSIVGGNNSYLIN